MICTALSYIVIVYLLAPVIKDLPFSSLQERAGDQLSQAFPNRKPRLPSMGAKADNPLTGLTDPWHHGVLQDL